MPINRSISSETENLYCFLNISSTKVVQMPNDNPELKKYLTPTYYIDFQAPNIQAKALELTQNIPPHDTVQKAIRVFYYVRDEIPYWVGSPKGLMNRANLRASAVLQNQKGYCIQKSALFVALLRALQIPARLHFVDIVNYLTPQSYIDRIGSNLMIYHGYGEAWLNGKWIEANVAFDKALCERKSYPMSEFDGVHPALFAHTDAKGDKFVDYLKDRGSFADIPYYRILGTWLIQYGIKGQIRRFTKKKQK